MPSALPTFNRSRDHRYAVFLASFKNDDMGNVLPRAVINDFCMFRDILIERYDYDVNKITCAVGDPVNGAISYSDGPNCSRSLKALYQGNKAGFDQALSTLSGLTTDDTLFLFISGHGAKEEGDDSESYLPCLAQGASAIDERYYASDLVAKLSAINCDQLIVLMNQCNCGGFINPLTSMTIGPNRVYVMAACSANQTTETCGTGTGTGTQFTFCDKHFPFSAAVSIALNSTVHSSLSGGVASCLPGFSSPTNLNAPSAEETFNFASQFFQNAPNQTPEQGHNGVNVPFYWGLPDVAITHGTPNWESPDIFLLEPSSVSSITDSHVDPSLPSYWGDRFHAGFKNRIVARVSNIGSAPAVNTTVRFYVSPFGINNNFSEIGSYTIQNINPGQHAYGFLDYDFPAEQHLCIIARASCTSDEAVSSADLFFNPNDNNNAQRNMDILYVPLSMRGRIFDFKRVFGLHHEVRKNGIFSVKIDTSLDRDRLALQPKRPVKGVKPVFGRRDIIAAGSISIPESMKAGERIRIDVTSRDEDRKQRAVGGITYTIELADGRLEGRIVSQSGMSCSGWEVTIWHTRQSADPHTSRADDNGNFQFKEVLPGTYRFRVASQTTKTEGFIFVEPNRTTTTTITVD